MTHQFTLNVFAKFFYVFVSVFLLTNLFSIKLSAAEFYYGGGENCTFTFEGVIYPGDAERFFSYTSDLNNTAGSAGIVCLNSPGGSLHDALDIALYVQRKPLGTRVAKASKCLSGCAFIFMAGATRASDFHLPDRKMHVTSILGFHSPYLRKSSLDDLSLPPQLIQESTKYIIESFRKISELFYFPQHFRYSPSNTAWVDLRILKFVLDSKQEDFFYIDTFGKIWTYEIQVNGLEPNYDISPSRAAQNGCRNRFLRTANLHDAHWIDAKIIDTPPKSLIAEIKSYFGKDESLYFFEMYNGGSGGATCAVSIDAECIECGAIGAIFSSWEKIEFNELDFFINSASDKISKFGPKFFTVSVDRLNLRSGPNIKEKIIGSLNKGDIVIPLNEQQGNWLKIENSTKIGWIQRLYIE